MVKRPSELRWTQNFLDACNSQCTCTKMHSRNNFTIVDWSGQYSNCHTQCTKQ